MTKLQSICRSNGSVVFMINIPKEFIEELQWSKGMDLDISNNNSILSIFPRGDDL